MEMILDIPAGFCYSVALPLLKSKYGVMYFPGTKSWQPEDNF